MAIVVSTRATLMAIVLLAACGRPHRPPPSYQSFGGLPVSGSLADARRAGFTRCVADNVSMRCERDDVTLAGRGPYNAAVDLVGSDGRGGFALLTMWNDGDQYEVHTVGDELAKRGWRSCYTGDANKGDQMIYTREGASVRVSIDLSYWGKRRLRVFPEWHPKRPRC